MPPVRDVTGISIDSRTLTPGDAFFAIVGDRFDGHDFVDKALGAGAACAIVSKPVTGDPRELIVPDVMDALRALARAARARMAGRVIGITGSVGKTSTKEMLATICARAGRTHAAKASFNNHWGVPLTLARMPADTEFAVCEIGMNHAGEIRPLTGMVRPHVAIVTTVEAVHIEFFDSVEGIADAKAEIFEGLEPDGIAVLNTDNAHFARLANVVRQTTDAGIVSFGWDSGADMRLTAVEATPEGSRFTFTQSGQPFDATLKLHGDHMAMNALAAIAAAIRVGIAPTAAIEALAEVRPASGRGVRETITLAGGDLLLIDESYNANPTSVRAALGVLARAEGRKVAVLGDMLELGERAEALHAGLTDDIRAANAVAYVCGPSMKALHDALGGRSIWATDAAALRPLLLADLAAGDTVMVKGSLGSRMAPIAEAIRGLAYTS